jgi:hypothetical protein
MFEILVMSLLAIIALELFSANRALRATTQLLAELATNPIRHSVDISSSGNTTLSDIENQLAEINENVSSLERHFVSSDLDD